MLPRRLVVAVVLLAGMLSVAAAAAAGLSLGRNDRARYLPVRAGDYYPAFFTDHARGRVQQALWLTNPQSVALRYAGPTRLCPNSSLRILSQDDNRASYVLTNECGAGAVAVKQRRVDLVRVADFWEIEWAGVLYKCSRDTTNPGSYLMRYNPLRQLRANWAQPWNDIMRWAAIQLNPWQTSCPP
jgi:hypothetical protein